MVGNFPNTGATPMELVQAGKFIPASFMGTEVSYFAIARGRPEPLRWG